MWPTLVAVLSVGVQIIAGYTAKPTLWQALWLVAALGLATLAAGCLSGSLAESETGTKKCLEAIDF